MRDPARFDALYRKYLAQVYSYAFYELGDHHDAEDATERTFLLALGALPRFEERARPADGEGASTFRVWLFQIARNVVANVRRRRRRRPEAPLERPPRLADPLATTAADAAARREAAEALGRGRRRLPADRRRALVLRFVDEMSTAEIAGRARALRGRRPRADPPRAAGVAARPGRARRERTSARDRRDRRARHGRLHRVAPGGARSAGGRRPERRRARPRRSRSRPPASPTELPRVHPSFRFEERLARRLADAAAADAPRPGGGEPGRLERARGVIELGPVGLGSRPVRRPRRRSIRSIWPTRRDGRTSRGSHGRSDRRHARPRPRCRSPAPRSWPGG